MSTYLAVTVVAMAVGLFLCVPAGLTLWAVLGESHFAIRLAGLLACIGLIGAFLANNAPPKQLSQYCALLLVFLFLGSSIWLFQHWYRIILAGRAVVPN